MKKAEENKQAKGETENKDAAKDADNKGEDEEAQAAHVAALEEELEELREYKAAREAQDAELARIDAQRGVKINREPEYHGSRVKPGRRLYLTADKKRLVPAGHKDARSLYCTEHSQVPREEFERLKSR